MRHTQAFLLLFSFLGALPPMNNSFAQDTPPYLNPSVPLDVRVKDLLSRMTLEEKAAQWVHNSPAIERLGIPAYDWWSEGLHGVARAGYATVFPQAIGLAAMWNTDLMERIGTAVADEARAKHHDFVRRGERGQYKGLTCWSPNINLFRDPRWGRGMETFGEDPFLTGKTGAAFIRGLQGHHPRYLKLVGTMKHFAVHSGPEPERHSFDAVVNERDLRESYLPHFRMCLEEANVQSVMCAYNRFAGQPCCGSNRLLAEILREEWGFDGYVTSDCGAIGDIFKGHGVARDAAEAAAMAIRAGTDLNCSFGDAAPLEAVRRGLMAEEDLDRSIGRLFRARFRLGMFDPPGMVPFAGFPFSLVGSKEHRELALTAAQQSIVLLRNKDDVLPLRTDLKTIAVIGPNADDVLSLLGNYYGIPQSPVTPLSGIREYAGKSTEVLYAPGCPIADGVPLLESVGEQYLSHTEPGDAGPGGTAPGLTAEYFAGRGTGAIPSLTRIDTEIRFNWCPEPPIPGLDSTHFTVRWSGFLEPPVTGRYHLGTFGFSGFSIRLDDSVVATSRGGNEKPIHAPVDLAAGRRYRFQLEGTCRTSGTLVQFLWEPPFPDVEEQALQLARRADVVVLVLGLSPRVEGEEMQVDVEGFRGGDRTDIVLPQPQERLLRAVGGLGKTVVLVLMNGSQVAIPWAAENVPAILECWYPGQDGGRAIAEAIFGKINPGGRLPVTMYRSVNDLPPFEDYRMSGRTYRFFDGEPLFPFGHGLSYTSFTYENLTADGEMHTASSDALLRVEVDVVNTGRRSGDEVVQLYVRALSSEVPRSRQDLRGFRRISLEPGERQRVSFDVRGADLAYFDTSAHRWQVEPGRYEILIGASSRDIRGRSVVTVR